MSIYKDCDIRGVYKEEFDEITAGKIGRAVGTIIKGKTILVCGDVRVSTPVLKEALIEGLVASGAKVIDMGFSPTPVFYFAKHFLDAYAGVMVTASHNPAKYNGFKLMFGEWPVVPDDIKKIAEIAEGEDFYEAKGSLEVVTNIEDEYLKMVESFIGKGDLKVVVDCCDGTTAKIAPRAFSHMGYTVEELYCDWDGTFPNRDPNPAVYANLTDLQKKVVEVGADMGVAFDGDGDRVVFVDDKGEILVSEQSLVVLLREYLKDKKSSVVYDLKSSSIVARETKKLGSRPIMERSGHAFIKRTYRENNSALAGEISGHFFFEELGQDDGIYAALKMAEIVCKSGKKLSEIAATIEKTEITPDIRIPWSYENQDSLIEKMEELGKKYSLSKIDGIRIDFGYGWALVRKSVTEQAVTVRIEADDRKKMGDIVAILIAAEKALDVEQLAPYKN